IRDFHVTGVQTCALPILAASGIALAVQAGLPDIVFGGVGALPESFAPFAPRAVHGALAWVLLALIAIHIVAALYHQLVRRDALRSEERRVGKDRRGRWRR